MCQSSGFPPISTMGLGLTTVSSERRVPNPPAKIPTFISHLPFQKSDTSSRARHDLVDQSLLLAPKPVRESGTTSRAGLNNLNSNYPANRSLVAGEESERDLARLTGVKKHEKGGIAGSRIQPFMLWVQKYKQYKGRRYTVKARCCG